MTVQNAESVVRLLDYLGADPVGRSSSSLFGVGPFELALKDDLISMTLTSESNLLTLIAKSYLSSSTLSHLE